MADKHKKGKIFVISLNWFGKNIFIIGLLKEANKIKIGIIIAAWIFLIRIYNSPNLFGDSLFILDKKGIQKYQIGACIILWIAWIIKVEADSKPRE